MVLRDYRSQEQVSLMSSPLAIAVAQASYLSVLAVLGSLQALVVLKPQIRTWHLPNDGPTLRHALRSTARVAGPPLLSVELCLACFGGVGE